MSHDRETLQGPIAETSPVEVDQGGCCEPPGSFVAARVVDQCCSGCSILGFAAGGRVLRQRLNAWRRLSVDDPGQILSPGL